MATEAQTIADLATKAGGAHVITTADGRELLIMPEGFTSKDVTDPNGLIPGYPIRIRQAVVVQTTDSLVEYANRFKGENTLLFADIAANSIRAMIDYHGPTEPTHNDHRALLELPFSEEWKTWTAQSGRLMGQLDFARFLEENAVDVVAPSGADLLEVCRDLQAKRKVDFRKAVRTATDNENFEYTEETTAGTGKNGAVEIPTKFGLSLPVYFGSAPVSLFAFLRWRLNEGDLTLGYALHRAEHVRQAVFKTIVDDVAARTERTAVFGRPS